MMGNTAQCDWPCQINHYAYSIEEIFLQNFRKSKRNVSSILIIVGI